MWRFTRDCHDHGLTAVPARKPWVWDDFSDIVHGPSMVPIASPNTQHHHHYTHSPSPTPPPQHSEANIFWSLNMSFKQIRMLTVRLLVSTTSDEPISRWPPLNFAKKKGNIWTTITPLPIITDSYYLPLDIYFRGCVAVLNSYVTLLTILKQLVLTYTWQKQK